MKVQEILNESTSVPAFDGKYPLARKALEEQPQYKRYIERFDKGVEYIKAALEAGEVINTYYADIKSYCNNFIEYAFKQAISEKYTYGGKYKELPEDMQWFDLPSSAREVPFMMKKLSKLSAESKKTDMYKDAFALGTELLNLTEVDNWLKAHTIKASVKKAEAKAAKDTEKAEYQKKYTDHKDVKKVVDLLKGKAKEVEEGIYKSQLKWLNAIVADYQKAVEGGETDYTKLYQDHPFYRFVIQGLVSRVHNPDFRSKTKVFTLDKNWKKKIDADAKKTASDIVDGFVYKNSGKLSYILYNKNNMKNVELKNVELGRGAVEAQLHVTFEDGSEFLADSSVVYAVSKLGNPFYRYPTIFRNVKMPDGSKLAGPSEQKMDEVFAIAK